MSNLHVVYRVDEPGTSREQWSTYSFPEGIYVSAAGLDEVRAEFREAIEFAVADADRFTVIEHLERPLAPGSYIRTAVDRRTLDRDATERVMRGSLQLIDQWQHFQEAMPSAATDDTVMIACVPDDRLGWVFEQMSDHDAIGVCALGPEAAGGQLIWWSFLVGQFAEGALMPQLEPLSATGLSSEATISEFMRSTASTNGRQLLRC